MKIKVIEEFIKENPGWKGESVALRIGMDVLSTMLKEMGVVEEEMELRIRERIRETLFTPSRNR